MPLRPWALRLGGRLMLCDRGGLTHPLWAPWYHLQEEVGFFHLPKAGAHPAKGFSSRGERCLPPAWKVQGAFKVQTGRLEGSQAKQGKSRDPPQPWASTLLIKA